MNVAKLAEREHAIWLSHDSVAVGDLLRDFHDAEHAALVAMRETVVHGVDSPEYRKGLNVYVAIRRHFIYEIIRAVQS